MPTATSTSTSTWPSACSPPATRTPIFARGPGATRRQRHVLHVPGRGQHHPGRGDQAPLRVRPGALLQLGHRSDDGRDSRRARLHRAREDPQVRGRLPRPPRRRAGVDPATARVDRVRPRRRTPCPPRPVCPPRASTETVVAPYNNPEALAAILDRHRGRDRGDHHRAGPVQHRRRAAAPRLPGARPRAGHAARRACSSSTRSRPASCSPTAARPSGSASSPTCSAWPSRSAAACPSAPSAAVARSWASSRRLPDPGGRCRDHRPGPLDHPRWRDARRPPGHIQRQPAVDGRRRGSADQDPDARRLSAAAGAWATD